jgi:hypothetical protein
MFRHFRKFAKSDHTFRHVCPSDQMEQLVSHQTHFHEIYYLSIFRNCLENSIFIKILQK